MFAFWIVGSTFQELLAVETSLRISSLPFWKAVECFYFSQVSKWTTALLTFTWAGITSRRIIFWTTNPSLFYPGILGTCDNRKVGQFVAILAPKGLFEGWIECGIATVGNRMWSIDNSVGHSNVLQFTHWTVQQSVCNSFVTIVYVIADALTCLRWMLI